jgi:hypothetical protein
MDGESYRKNEKKILNRNNCPNVSDIFQPTRVRCSIRICDEIDGFLLDYGFNFLPYFSGIIYAILLLKEAI